MKIAFQTFGCRLNRAETLDQEAQLLAEGHDVIPLDGEVPPELIVVRCCSVTAKAERDCRAAIARLRASHPAAKIEVTGCIANRTQPSSIPSPRPTAQGTVPIPLRTSRAYLKIQDGCAGNCAFCIVPFFRGQPRSRPFGKVLARASAFLAAGYREVVVTGCNLALYRDSGHGLADVLSALAELKCASRHRVRLSSLEPGICDAAVLKAVADHPNICRFLHLSVQSGSDNILGRMKRPYEIKAVDRFCAAAIRQLGPRLALGADIITGFPGETEEDFAATRAFLLRHPFANLHVFPFSERPGTTAATLPNKVPPAMRRARARELATLGLTRRKAFARSFLGQQVEVCIERSGRGWTAEYLKARQGLEAFPRRSLVSARVIGVEDDELVVAP